MCVCVCGERERERERERRFLELGFKTNLIQVIGTLGFSDIIPQDPSSICLLDFSAILNLVLGPRGQELEGEKVVKGRSDSILPITTPIHATKGNSGGSNIT